MVRKLILLVATLLLALPAVRAQDAKGSALFKEMQRENQQLRKQLQENRQLLQDCQGNLEKLKEQLASREEAMQKQQAALRESEEANQKLAEQLDRANESHGNLQQTLAAQKARSEKLQEIVDELKFLVEKQAGAVNSQKKQLTALRESTLGASGETLEDRVNLHYNLAVLYDKTQMYERAEEQYRRCLELDPEDAAVHYNLGILYEDKLDNPRRALKHYEAFLSLNPDPDDARRVSRWVQELKRGL